MTFTCTVYRKGERGDWEKEWGEGKREEWSWRKRVRWRGERGKERRTIRGGAGEHEVKGRKREG